MGAVSQERKYFFYVSGNPTSTIETVTEAWAPFKIEPPYTIYSRPLQIRYKCRNLGFLFSCEEIHWANKDKEDHRKIIPATSFIPSLRMHNLPHRFTQTEEIEVMGEITEFLDMVRLDYVLLSQDKTSTRILEGNHNLVDLQIKRDRAFVPGYIEATTTSPLGAH